MELEEKRRQVADQYRVVSHLARTLAKVHDDIRGIIEKGGVPALDDLLDLQGKRSAHIMEVLGDILNGMDANSEEDDWTYPIFKAAHIAFPSLPGPQP